METVTIQKEEYNTLKKKASRDDVLLKKLVEGLEDIKNGRLKIFKKPVSESHKKKALLVELDKLGDSGLVRGLKDFLHGRIKRVKIKAHSD